MSAVNLTNVAVLDNPAMFLNPFRFEISYECLAPLKDGSISHFIFFPLLILEAFSPVTLLTFFVSGM